MAGKLQETAAILANEQVAQGVWCMSVAAGGIAARALPGQFVHVRAAENPVQFLRMPFAVYDVAPGAGHLDICYQVVGPGTRRLSELACGQRLDLIGPVGNGWQVPPATEHALLVGGGVGTPALNLLARQLLLGGVTCDIAVGALTKAKLCCLEGFTESLEHGNGSLHVATDDGSAGVAGFVTAITDGLIASGAYDYVAACGPAPMMRNAVRPALKRGISCQVSMEKLMACGVGACLSCVVETTQGRRRCCVDGPVFDAAEVVW